ncbi:O-antigen ligase family protein [Streptomyces sp. IBSBF 2806]|uniref:O-antigen ligase family protein n=1 Tax=Streptomyces sp. IBSBF 2806 TaxID=2903529 RepID=UPI002FDC6B64
MTQHQTDMALVMGVLALLSLIPAAIALRRARAFGDWDLTSTMILLVGVLANLSTILYVVHSGRSERLDSLGDVVIGLPTWVNQIGAVANGTMLVACLAFALHRLLIARAKVRAAPLIALALALLLTFSDGLHGLELFAPRQLVLLAALLAAAVARPGRPAFVGGAAVVLLTTLLGGVEALVQPDTVLRECRPDNPCGVLGILYAGVFTNENIFSLLLVVGIPFVWLGLRGPVRIVLAFYVAFVAVASGSRLATATAVATLVFLIVLRPRLPEEAKPGDRRVSTGKLLLTAPILGVAAAVGLIAPFHHPGPGTLGDRALIWDMARDELHDGTWFGLGGKAWAAKYPAGEIPAAVSPSLHNQWIDLLFAGGVVALALFVTLLVVLLVRGGATAYPAAASVLLPVLLTSVLERPWSFSISNSLTFALVTAVLVPTALRRATAAAAPGSGSSPAELPARTPRRSPSATGPVRSTRR